MGSAAVTTVFQPDPACFAPSNLWLLEGPCRDDASVPASLEPCSFAHHGRPRTGRDLDPCYPDTGRGAGPTYYTGCPASFTAAVTWRDDDEFYAPSRDPDGGIAVTTICCPDAYSYHHDWYRNPYSTKGDGWTVNYRPLDRPGCIATSVEVLRSSVVTVTVAGAARDAEETTTTTTWADDAVLYAGAVTVTATEYYGGYAAHSTCWGGDCPAAFTATFADAPVAAPATARFTPPPDCTDPANVWSVTTSCYVTSAPGRRYPDSRPAWLRCAVTQVGGNEFGAASSCAPPAPSDADGSYYAACPAGYTAVLTSTRPAYDTHLYTVGYYDAIYHQVRCCPDAYDFEAKPSYDFGQDVTTVHDGQRYGVFQYPPPDCFATSVAALSGRDVPMRTHSAGFGWDKRQEEPEFPVTHRWDYEGGTLYAPPVYVSSTVFMGTHTCYESCSTWISYYYPDSTGGPSPTSTPTPTPETSGSARESPAPSTDGAGSGAAPRPSDRAASGSADEASPEPSSPPSSVPESGAKGLARGETVGASGLAALVTLWLAL